MAEDKMEYTWTVRPCKEQDLEAARGICEETSTITLSNEKDRQFLLLTFCDAYVRYAPDSFVAADAADRPVGYVFCAADTRRFFRLFRKNVLPEIAKLGVRYGLWGYGVCISQSLCALIAPAHLHIDLTASARRKGIGTQLIRTLKAHLAQKGISRIVLTVSRKNVSAIRFYEKNGFRTILKPFGVCVMRADTEMKNE